MRRVRLFTLMAGPEGVFQPGDHEMTDGQAAGVVAAGAGEYLDRAPQASTLEASAPQVATVTGSEREQLPRRQPAAKPPAKGK